MCGLNKMQQPRGSRAGAAQLAHARRQRRSEGLSSRSLRALTSRPFERHSQACIHVRADISPHTDAHGAPSPGSDQPTQGVHVHTSHGTRHSGCARLAAMPNTCPFPPAPQLCAARPSHVPAAASARASPTLSPHLSGWGSGSTGGSGPYRCTCRGMFAVSVAARRTTSSCSAADSPGPEGASAYVRMRSTCLRANTHARMRLSACHTATQSVGLGACQAEGPGQWCSSAQRAGAEGPPWVYAR